MLDVDDFGEPTVSSEYHVATMHRLNNLHREVMDLHRQIEGKIENEPEAAASRTRKRVERVVMARIKNWFPPNPHVETLKKSLGVHLGGQRKTH